MLNKLKSQKGITGIDLSVSIIIIMLFVSVIAALSINVSSSLASKRRLEIASNCMTKIMETVDEMDYNNVEEISDFWAIDVSANYTATGYGLRQAVQTILNNEEENYDILSVYLKVENYVPSDYAPETAPDLVKKVTVKITYKLNNQDETIEVTRIKPRYNVDLEGTTTLQTD